MFSIPQSTSFVYVFKAFLSSDGVTEATSKTIAITISKAGGAFGNPNAGATNATEISSGWYKVTLDTTDTGTLGILAIRGAVATINDVGDRLFVVKATNGGLTALPDTAVTTNGSLITSGNSTAQLKVTSGAASIDWANVTNQTTAVNLSGTSTKALEPSSAGEKIDVSLGAVNANLIGTSFDAIAFAVWDAQTSGFGTDGSFGEQVRRTLDATVSSRMATFSVPTNFGSLAISATGIVSSDIKKVNAITVTGSGTAGTPWGP